MVASVLARLMGKGLSKTGKKESSEVAKKGTELMGRRPNKDMGMVEEVTPKRLSGPEVRESGRQAEKKGGRNAALAASAAAHAAAIGAVAMSDRNKEDKKEPTKVVSASRMSEGKVTKAAEPVEQTSKAKEASKPSTFNAAFKEARAAGKDVFTYNGKKYTTEMAGEKKATTKASEKATGVREGRNENIGDDTRERARAFVEAKMGPRALAAEDDATKRLAKGGAVMANCGASVPPAQKRK